jgi:acetyl-CoA carboxylase carboxyl transferase subunit alpha
MCDTSLVNLMSCMVTVTSDDPALVAWRRLDEPVMVIGHQKGREIREKYVVTGMPRPEGYRKRAAWMEMAELLFKMPS